MKHRHVRNFNMHSYKISDFIRSLIICAKFTSKEHIKAMTGRRNCMVVMNLICTVFKNHCDCILQQCPHNLSVLRHIPNSQIIMVIWLKTPFKVVIDPCQYHSQSIWNQLHHFKTNSRNWKTFRQNTRLHRFLLHYPPQSTISLAWLN